MLMSVEQDTADAAQAQPATPRTVPVLPSEAEVEQHELTHLPFQNWCRVPRVKKSLHHGSWVKMERRLPFHLVMTD